MKKHPKKRKSMTQSDLAAILGTTRQAIAHHEKSGDAPKRDDLAGWETLLASKGRTSSDPKGLRHDLAKARLAIAEEQGVKLKRENLVAAGKLIDLAEVSRQSADAENFYHSQMEALERTAPAMLRGCNEIEIRDKLGEFLKRLRQLSREKFRDVGKVK